MSKLEYTTNQQRSGELDKPLPIQIKDFYKNNGILKGVLDKLIGDFGKNRKAIPTGAVSSKLKVIRDINGKAQIDTGGKRPREVYNIEHFIPLGQLVANLMVYDFLIGLWKFKELENGELDGLEKGQNYIQTHYPLFHMSTIVTVEENIELIKVVYDFIKDATDEFGLIHYDEVLERCLNGEHYVKVGITFHKEYFEFNGKKIYPHLLPKGLQKLMGKKSKKIKEGNEWW
jgi:hypothetical protein